MGSTIFKKQFFTYLFSIIITFTIFAFAMFQALELFFIKKQEETLLEHSTIIVSKYKEARISGNIFNEIQVFKELSSMEKYLNVEYIVLDKERNVLSASTDIMRKLEITGSTYINIPSFDKVSEGNVIITEGTLDGLYKDKFLTVAYPIMFENNYDGLLLINSSIPEIKKSVTEIFKVTVVLLLISVSFSFIFIYISSKNITKPIKEMNEAAKIISSGDFKKRIEVHSNDEVGQLANSFNSMAKNLNLQEEHRREFISNISHDLRSPLTSINGFLQAMLDGTIPTEKQDRYLTIIMEETDRLSKLANDILDINKLEVLELEKSDFDINELIRKLIIQFENRFLEKNIELEISFSEEKNLVFADEDKIKRVLYNLIDNAIKFTQDGGSISVETASLNEKIYISVKDSGIGIGKEDQERIFDRFFKADASRGVDKNGIGLGLSIIKEFINAHGEEITLVSDIDKGCEFIFTLTPKAITKKNISK